MKKLVPVLCVFSFSVPLFAQQGTTGVVGFSFVAPLKVGVGTDHNFLINRTPPNERLFDLSLPPSVQPLAPGTFPKRLDDDVMSITLPKIAFQNYSRRHEFFMTYAPELEMFRDNSDQNTWNHEAALTFTYHISRNIQVSAGDSFLVSRDPSRTLENVFLLVPRSRYAENGIRAEVNVQTSGVTGFQVRYDTTRSTYGQNGVTNPFQARILDTVANGVNFTMTHLLNRTQRLRVKMSFYKFDPINQAGAVITSEDQSLIRGLEVQYRMRPSPTSSILFTGGASGVASQLTYTLGLIGDKRFGKLWLGGGFT